jgi:uncharacterized protein YihD (DUF1040 family)
MRKDMKTLEIVRKLDGFEKRLADLTKDYSIFKESINGEKESKKVDTSKSNTKKLKE